MKLEVEYAIDYGIIVTYMNKRNWFLKVDADAAKSILNHMGNEMIESATKW